ncbi:hypothetical protein [Streptococcus suis]|uniref:hypothetical protein n=1 Tax=Streptococcus suis TaxID=1307 RepID=UPI002412B8DE|nr:hypothetical protein [Streptococcus suis]
MRSNQLQQQMRMVFQVFVSTERKQMERAVSKRQTQVLQSTSQPGHFQELQVRPITGLVCIQEV